MVRRKITCLAYPISTIMILIAVACMLSINIFLIYLSIAEIRSLIIIWVIIWIVLTTGLCICVLCIIAKPLLSIVRIDETGITRAFLGRFWKIHISWDELTELRCFTALVWQMVFSKTKKLEDIPIKKWHKLKDVIFFGYSKKRYAIIEQYLKHPAMGMSDWEKARVERYKAKKGYSKDEKPN